jgi:hypothetical protein
MEKRCLTHWLDFLQDLEGSNQLGQLLMFATGLDNIPPLGLHPAVCIELFSHKEDFKENNHRKEFLIANTCANTLKIPMLSTYDAFKENMMAALQIVTFTSM